MKFISVCLMIALLALPTFGGINSVGKGGGFGEMLVVMLDNSLPTFLRICLNQPAICRLGDGQAAIASDLMRALPRLQALPLKFIAECRTKAVTVTSEALEITSCALYVDPSSPNSSPKPLGELAAIIAKARLLQLAGQGADTLALPSLRMTEQVFQTTLDNGRVDLHVVEFKANWYERTTSLVIEAPRGAADITTKLLPLLCPHSQAKNWEAFFDRNEATSSDSVVFSGRVSWECAEPGSITYAAKVTVGARINSGLEVSEDSVVIRISQKEIK